MYSPSKTLNKIERSWMLEKKPHILKSYYLNITLLREKKRLFIFRICKLNDHDLFFKNVGPFHTKMLSVKFGFVEEDFQILSMLF